MAALNIPINGGSKAAANYELALQAYQTEPAILAQAINAGMRRVVRTEPAIQAAVPFLEGLMGRRLTYTMADVAPLADAVRRRIGLKTVLVDAQTAAKPNSALYHVSVYASLLGQAMAWQMKVSSLIELMRAWAKCISDTRMGPPTAISRELVNILEAEYGNLTKQYAAGDSKDLFALMSGTLENFKEGTPNELDDESKLACKTKVVLVAAEDGLTDLTDIMTAMTKLAHSLQQTIGAADDYVSLPKARRNNKEFEFTGVDKKNAAANIGDLMAAFRAHGRLFIKAA